MTPRAVAATVLVLAGTAVCVRLGLWQIDRWHEKQRWNAELRASLAAPAMRLAGEPPARTRPGARRVEIRGRFDQDHQVLLSNRTHDGAPGVEVVTPLVLEGSGSAVLVDRGWLYAPDASTASPGEFPEPGPREVVGLPFDLRRGAGGAPLRALPAGRGAVWSARWLDLDTLSARLPYALLPWGLRELPGPGVPSQPLRLAPRPLDQSTHINYAIQWFLFGAILLVGSAALARSRGRRIAPEDAADPDLHRRG